MSFDPVFIVVKFLALLPALVVHEFAHAYSAYRFGDPTPKMQGRVTLNPLPHLDPIGTLMILFGPIGWAKPVEVNPYNMRDPARHFMISTACGPISNVTQGIAWSLILRAVLTFGPAGIADGNPLVGFLALCALINFSLAIFNLIPLGVLDGHEILRYHLPYEAQVRYHGFNQRYGMAVLLGLIFLPHLVGVDVLGYLLLPGWRLAAFIAGTPLWSIIGRAFNLR